ncbi:MAG: Wzz/FepE/Etk N-terminal domain-containing protein [Anaerolineae bacterium]
MEQAIDLGKYLEILIRRWYLIIIPSVVCTVIVAAMVLSQPKQYQAKVSIVAIRSTAQVSYNTAITTSTQETIPAASLAQRLVSLSLLVRSSNIAQAVLTTLGEKLPTQKRTTGSLYNMVESEIVPKSDLIAIKVTHADKELALEIADAWALEYVRQVNALYNSADTEAYASIQREVPTAKTNYESAQAVLEKTIKETHLGDLVRRGDAISAMIVALNATRLRQAQAQLDAIAQTEVLIQAAQDLRDQLKTGGSAAALSSSMALSSLKLQVFGALPPTPTLVIPLQLQASSVPMDSQEMISDVESLVAVLLARQQEQSSSLRKVTESVQQGDSWTLVPGTTDQQMDQQVPDSTLDLGLDQVLLSLENQLRDLQTAIEQANSELNQATSERDLARETYINLIRKEAELKLAIATAGAEVRLGTSAVATTLGNDLERNLIIAATTGMLFGVLSAFAVDYWLRYRTRLAASGGATAKPVNQ